MSRGLGDVYKRQDKEGRRRDGSCIDEKARESASPCAKDAGGRAEAQPREERQVIIKVTYDDQRLDVFDTTTFTSAAPFGKTNMLTNFEVRFDTIGEGGLWMAAHSYQAI